jgi:hypothetical protein
MSHRLPQFGDIPCAIAQFDTIAILTPQRVVIDSAVSPLVKVAVNVLRNLALAPGEDLELALLLDDNAVFK